MMEHMSMSEKITPKFYEYEYWLFLCWLLLISLIVFGISLCWSEGYFYILNSTDKSRISLLIAALFALGTIHCAFRALYLSDQLALLPKPEDINSLIKCDDKSIRLGSRTLPVRSLVGNYLYHLDLTSEQSDDNNRETNGIDILIAKAKGSHDIGWHLVDVLLKLGLIGTIIGFILMLNSVSNTETLDVDSMQLVLKQMSAGMGTALFTTLVGMMGSVLLGLQYLMLDKGADMLIENALEISDDLNLRQSVSP